MLWSVSNYELTVNLKHLTDNVLIEDIKVSIKVNSQNTYEFKITIDEENNELIRELKGLSKGDLNSLIKDALKTQIELKKNKKIRPHFKKSPPLRR